MTVLERTQERAENLRAALLQEWRYHKLAHAKAVKPSLEANEIAAHIEGIAAVLKEDEKLEAEISAKARDFGKDAPAQPMARTGE